MAASRCKAVAAHMAVSADEWALEARLYLAPTDYIPDLEISFAYFR